MEWFKSKSCSNSFIKSSSHVGSSSQEAFCKRMRLLHLKLGDNLVKLHMILTFPLYKASPDAYRSYRMNFVYCFIYLCIC
jgi:hypothetical protein